MQSSRRKFGKDVVWLIWQRFLVGEKPCTSVWTYLPFPAIAHATPPADDISLQHTLKPTHTHTLPSYSYFFFLKKNSIAGWEHGLIFIASLRQTAISNSLPFLIPLFLCLCNLISHNSVEWTQTFGTRKSVSVSRIMFSLSLEN